MKPAVLKRFFITITKSDVNSYNFYQIMQLLEIWMDGWLAKEMDAARAVMKTPETSGTTFVYSGPADASANHTLFPGIPTITCRKRCK